MKNSRRSPSKLLAVILLLSFMFCLVSCSVKVTSDKNGVTVTSGSDNEAGSESLDELYDNAVRDSVFSDEDEIMPLVNITEDDENVLWDDEGRVLMAFMHKYPDSYPEGEDIELQWGNVWCVSAKELCRWIQDNGDDVDDWNLRLTQLLGLSTAKEYTTISAIWVDADLLYRPANVSDAAGEMKAQYTPTGDEEFDEMYKNWFDSNIIWSYFDGSAPWTRLGYTYDWADNGKEYGLSEFLVFSGADAKVEYTRDVDDFVEYAKSLE